MAKKTVIKLIKKYIQFLLQKKYKIKKVYIFGSYKKKLYNKNSDIDVAIIIQNMKNSYNVLLEMMKYRREFDTRIEPHIFNETDFNSDNPMANEILKTGIKII